MSRVEDVPAAELGSRDHVQEWPAPGFHLGRGRLCSAHGAGGRAVERRDTVEDLTRHNDVDPPCHGEKEESFRDDIAQVHGDGGKRHGRLLLSATLPHSLKHTRIRRTADNKPIALESEWASLVSANRASFKVTLHVMYQDARALVDTVSAPVRDIAIDKLSKLLRRTLRQL